jgi:hypothetical protein
MKINKEGSKITFELDIDNTRQIKNGDYNIIHNYDEEQLKLQIKNGKIDQLVIWLNQTFRYDNIPLDNSAILSAYNLFNSNKDDFVKLVEWLNKDNYD